MLYCRAIKQADASNIEAILMTLRKKREVLHQKIMQIDGIIKRVQDRGYETIEPVKEIPATKQRNDSIEHSNYFPKTADIKIQVLRVFDVVGHAAKLSELQEEYTKLSGSDYNIREIIRSLRTSGLVKIMKQQKAGRGLLWVNSGWIENGHLLDTHKAEGFDTLNLVNRMQFE